MNALRAHLPRPRRSTWTTGVLAGAVMLALSACGGGGSGGGADGGPVELTVATIPTIDAAPLYLGQEQGFFKEENLKVTFRLADGGAAIIPGVVSGDYQFGHSNIVSELLAASEGLPLRAVTGTSGTGTDPAKDVSQILVAGDSPITEPKDLEGKTIAVNSLKNIGEVTIKASLEKQGVDVSTLKWQEMPFPDMNAALAQGRIDAIWQLEPFLHMAKEQGARSIISNFVATSPDAILGHYVTTRQYAEENPDVVERFARAVDKSKKYATEHPEEARRVLSEQLEIPAEQARAINLPAYQPGVDVETLRLYSKLMQRYGLIEEAPDLQALAPQATES